MVAFLYCFATPKNCMTASAKPVTDPSFDIFRTDRQPLNAIFSPQSVAIIGATDKPNSVGRTLLWNLMSNPFGGTIYPINPKRSSVLGITAYPAVGQVPAPVDLAVIAIPAPQVPQAVQECVAAGVKGAIIISAGFKEIGPAGRALEEDIMAIAQGKMRIIGPNCLGVMNPRSGLNATFANAMARPGHVGFISQSGAFCTSVLDWSFSEQVGFSAFVSIGSMLDVDWGDLINYLGNDPYTKSIIIYMESIGNARSFLSAAREVALTKPIIVIKAGCSEAAAQAAASHTGSLAGRDDVLDAAFRRSGVLRVSRIEELFDMAEVLAKQPRLPQGPRLSIITNAGGPGVLATDSLIATGGILATPAPETIEELNSFLPPNWSHHNPIDILGDAEPERYRKTLEVALKDDNSDGLLVILTPQAMTDPTETAKVLASSLETNHKPILASWMGGNEVTSGENYLNRASIPTYRYPDSAARLFNLLWRYQYNLRGLYETPTLTEHRDDHDRKIQAEQLIAQVRQQNRTLLTEYEAKQLLQHYDISTVPTTVASSPEEAIAQAEQFGYPVVLKLNSLSITHKTDVGGVQLNLRDGEEVRGAFEAIQTQVGQRAGAEHFQGVTVQPMVNLSEAYELILGSSLDVQFGPILLFGSGGQLVEVFRDRAVGLPPLNSTLARRLMEQTKIYTALQGVRGRQGVDLAALEQILVRFSQLVVEQPWIKEVEMNPLLASADGLLALDARVILHDPQTPPEQLPKCAIRPYPHQYIRPWTLKNGLPVTIRPIRPEDEPLMVQFHRHLSETSVYFRYFHLISLKTRTAHDHLTRICFIDYDREIALVAETTNKDGSPAIIGVARLSKNYTQTAGEVALMVDDAHQGQGLGTEMMQRLIEIARVEGLNHVQAVILRENQAMQRVCLKTQCQIQTLEPEVMIAHCQL